MRRALLCVALCAPVWGCGTEDGLPGGHAGSGTATGGGGSGQGGMAAAGGAAEGGTSAGGAAAGGSGGASATLGFGYPVGDGSTHPAGGWTLWQMMAHYWPAYDGRHLGHDVSLPGGVDAIGEPVISVGDGLVVYAKPNSSSYQNVVLIEHDVGDGRSICSFYAHIDTPIVSAGQTVTRGQTIAHVLDWADAVAGGASSNTHLHYVLLDAANCAHAAATGNTGGSNVCGYDSGGDNGLGRADLPNEPYYYTAVADACGASAFVDGFISPSQFIDEHHH